VKSRLTLAFLCVLATATRAESQRISFDNAKVGSAPTGWTLTKTGRGSPLWRVEAEASAPSKPNVFKQSGEATYPLALFDASNLRDGFVEVRFKPVSGREDQAAGVVWRARDADNYYICRANALENNVVLYKTEKGKRSSLDLIGRSGGYGTKAEVAKTQWHTLRVEFAGKRFKVIFDGKPLFEVEDATFADGGKVGLWTKADSVTLFDDFAFGPP
jgi:hypothetical protein